VVVRSDWVACKIPQELANAIDEFLHTKEAKLNGIYSRSDFLTRLAVAWFGAVNEKFKLFSPDIISSSFSRTHPPPILPSQLPELPANVYRDITSELRAKFEEDLKKKSKDKRRPTPPIVTSKEPHRVIDADLSRTMKEIVDAPELSAMTRYKLSKLINTLHRWAIIEEQIQKQEEQEKEQEQK
jgi:hypothetical protein